MRAHIVGFVGLLLIHVGLDLETWRYLVFVSGLCLFVLALGDER